MQGYLAGAIVLWFPRACVGTKFGRACVQCLQQAATQPSRDCVTTLARTLLYTSI